MAEPTNPNAVPTLTLTNTTLSAIGGSVVGDVTAIIKKNIMGMDKQTKISLLKDEYLMLQQFYEDFDKRIIEIKGWSATIAIAAIGGGFIESKYLWLFAAAASLVFWLLESLWKGFQYLYADRIKELESIFNSDDQKLDSIKPLQIYTSWFESLNRHGLRISSTFTLFIVYFPHLITLITGIMLFVLESYNVINFPRK